jgi:hypothetical protein
MQQIYIEHKQVGVPLLTMDTFISCSAMMTLWISLQEVSSEVGLMARFLQLLSLATRCRAQVISIPKRSTTIKISPICSLTPRTLRGK